MKTTNIRAPIVSVMGHVNHGKTSLIDSICFKNTLSFEVANITQHIKVYNIKTHNNKSITFIDTPGHEIFSSTRVRSGSLSDVIIIIIAVDEGIKQQTVEAISYAKRMCLPIIILINKVDKLTSNLQKIKNSLLKHDIIPEDMGGESIVLPISTRTRYGLQNVISAIFFYADFLDLKVNFSSPVVAIVIDVKVNKKFGIIITVLVKEGVLRIGQIIYIEGRSFKIKTIINDQGKELLYACPSLAVHVLGINFFPTLGIKISSTNNKVVIDKKKTSINISNDEKNFSHNNIKKLRIIIKADSSGSIETIKYYINKISSNNVKIIIHLLSLGDVSESDVILAKLTKSIILTFNVQIDKKVSEFIINNSINIKNYNTIDKLLNSIHFMFGELSKPKKKELLIGKAKVIAKININSFYIAGCTVIYGRINNNSLSKIIRNKKLIYNCKISSLKRYNRSVNEVHKGSECGILFDNFSSFEKNDIIEIYNIID